MRWRGVGAVGGVGGGGWGVGVVLCSKAVYGNAVWQLLHLIKLASNAQKGDNTMTGIGPKAQGKSTMRLELTGSLLGIVRVLRPYIPRSHGGPNPLLPLLVAPMCSESYRRLRSMKWKCFP